jgi:hypothetical protein
LIDPYLPRRNPLLNHPGAHLHGSGPRWPEPNVFLYAIIVAAPTPALCLNAATD